MSHCWRSSRRSLPSPTGRSPRGTRSACPLEPNLRKQTARSRRLHKQKLSRPKLLGPKLLGPKLPLASKSLRGCRISEQGNEQTLGATRVSEQEGQNRVYIEAKNRRALSAGLAGKSEGASAIRSKSLREACAEAAIRRLNTAKRCASLVNSDGEVEKDTNTTNGKRAEVNKENTNEKKQEEEAIKLGYLDQDQEEGKRKHRDGQVPASGKNEAGVPGALAGNSRTKPSPSAESNDDFWICDICTLVNPVDYLCGDGCGVEYPESSSWVARSWKSSIHLLINQSTLIPRSEILFPRLKP